LWGECQGSGKNPYQAQIDLAEVRSQVGWKLAGVSNKAIVNNNRNLTIPESMLFQVMSAADLDIWAGDIDRLLDGEAVPGKENASLRRHMSFIRSCWVKAACYQHRRDWIEALLIQRILGILKWMMEGLDP
jgi:hypothetical protein